MARFAVREDRGDGLDLRGISHGADEVSSRVYFAVRDAWWRTVPLTVRERRRWDTPAGFVLEVDAATAWDSHPMDIALRYVVDGDELSADCTATARRGFPYARIGFCVLFPADACRGRPATTWRAGVATILEFPSAIVTRDQVDPAANRFHRPFDRLETTLGSGARVRYLFDGEEFEFEDQRNWTDASYKAYSSPPPGGLPASTVDGARFAQRVRILVAPPDEPFEMRADDRGVTVGGPIGVVPPIGLYAGRLSPRSYRPASGFHELNATRPALAGYDSIELGVNGAVHAADDDSVLEATALHGEIVAQARAAHPGLPVRLAPVAFLDVAGDWRDAAGDYLPAPPPGPVPARLLGLLAATWVVASAARAVPAGPDEIRYLDAALPADAPAAVAVSRLAAAHGHEVLAVSAPAPLAALATAAVPGGPVTIALANTGPDPAPYRLPDGRAGVLEGFASAWFTLAGPVTRPRGRPAEAVRPADPVRPAGPA